MPRPRWKAGKTLSVRIKHNTWTLTQMLEPPFLLFFTPSADHPAAESILFPCAVTDQFLRLAQMKATKLRGIPYSPPRRWIENHHGGRVRQVWPGTPEQRTIPVLSSKPGGRLVEWQTPYTSHQARTIIENILTTDTQTIEHHERSVLWTFPLLNERLYLCHKFGRNIDPGKDIMFDRPLHRSYATYVDILVNFGNLTDWGYGDYLNLADSGDPPG